jgi:hypothetical protein
MRVLGHRDSHDRLRGGWMMSPLGLDELKVGLFEQPVNVCIPDPEM